MNGKGEEEAGEPASSLPGFALLGSSQELRVTDRQTDRADAAASTGTNLSVGMGGPPPPFSSCFFLLRHLNCPTMKMKPLLL